MSLRVCVRGAGLWRRVLPAPPRAAAPCPAPLALRYAPARPACLYTPLRHKSSNKKGDQDSDDEDFDTDPTLNRDSKVVKCNLPSMRTDIVLKSALGIARNKVEKLFYESKIRINGKKIMKKSAMVHVGDEIDVIKSISPTNPEHLYITRVEILNVSAGDENITLTVRRFKTLLIENYEDAHKAGPEAS